MRTITYTDPPYVAPPHAMSFAQITDLLLSVERMTAMLAELRDANIAFLDRLTADMDDVTDQVAEVEPQSSHPYGTID